MVFKREVILKSSVKRWIDQRNFGGDGTGQVN